MGRRRNEMEMRLKMSRHFSQAILYLVLHHFEKPYVSAHIVITPISQLNPFPSPPTATLVSILRRPSQDYANITPTAGLTPPNLDPTRPDNYTLFNCLWNIIWYWIRFYSGRAGPGEFILPNFDKNINSTWCISKLVDWNISSRAQTCRTSYPFF